MAQTLPAELPPILSVAQQTHVINIVRRAAKAEIMPRFRALATSDIGAKSRPDDLVTVADTAAEAMITRALQMTFPTALVVGEEAVGDDPSLLDQIVNAPIAFIVDPIDGTWNYANGLAMFGVIIAVTRFGKPEFGLIYDPVMDDWVLADSQSTARVERPTGAPRDLKVSIGKPIDALSGYVPLYLFSQEKRAKIAATLPGFARTSNLRCSAHEYRMLAQGHVDFLLTESLNPWDHAAGALICARAGGHVEMLSGGPYDATLRSGHLLAAPDKASWNRLKKVFSFLID